jgi:HSP20 family protein
MDELKPKENTMKLLRYHYPRVTGSDALNRLFEPSLPSLQRFGALFGDSVGTTAGSQKAPLDLYEDDQGFYAQIEVPGLNREAIDLNLEGGALTIRSVETEAKEGEEATYVTRRVLSVPDVVDQDHITASYEDGVLTVVLPKRSLPGPSRIEVK